MRSLDSVDARELPGTETSNYPFWSCDGKSIAFYSNTERMLKRVEALGGPSQRLCEAQALEGGSWSRQGVILFSNGVRIKQVSAAGGTCSDVTIADAAEERHTWPHVLPDGRSFLYVVRSRDVNVQGVYVSSLDHPEQRTRLLTTDTKALYAPPRHGRSGHLLWVRDRTLVAQRFDPAGSTLEGDFTPLAQNIAVGGGTVQGMQANRAAFWVSDTGLLVYRAGIGAGRALVWVDRSGKTIETLMQEERDGEILMARLSPDRTRMALARTLNDNTDLWIYELATARWNKLTSDPRPDYSPVWSHDSRHVIYAAERDGATQLYRIDANGGGQEQRLTDGPNPKFPWDWSQDGRYVIYTEQHPQNRRDIWILPLASPDKPIPFLTTADDESEARISPDSKWIAFVSNSAGNSRVFIRAFPGGPSGLWPVSVAGAANIEWHERGKELYYRGPTPGGAGALFAAATRFLPDRVEVGAAQELFRATLGSGLGSGVTFDGDRFLLFATPGDQVGDSRNRNPLTVVVNWQAALE